MTTQTDKEWYAEARKQTVDTLPDFIRKVRKSFDTYQDIFEKKNAPMEEGYKNGIIVGILLSYAAFNASANTYGYSCNQSGVVRNAFYHAIFGKEIPFDRI